MWKLSNELINRYRVATPDSDSDNTDSCRPITAECFVRSLITISITIRAFYNTVAPSRCRFTGDMRNL